MDNAQFDSSFQAAVNDTGEPYLKARTTIIDTGAQAIPRLKARQTPSADWKTGMVADIMLGWLTEKDLFEKCTRYVKGDLPGEPPITGKFTLLDRAKAVANLGKDVVPRLLEMIIKTREASDIDETGAVFGALSLLGDQRAVMPLLELLQSEKDADRKIGAASVLGRLRDVIAVQPLQGILLDGKQPTALRATAAVSLGELRDLRASVPLQNVLLDKTNLLELREAAVRAIDILGDPGASGALVRALPQALAEADEDDPSFPLIIIETLGKLGEASSLALLNDLAKKHSDEFIREAAQEAREKILMRTPGGRRP